MLKRNYHGWIYREQTPGRHAEFITHAKAPDGQTYTKYMGIGADGAAKAVDHFETTLGLGPVKLEETPIGLRVFTETNDKQ